MKLDFHSHILPGIDDGAADIEDSIFLARSMKDWGFERIYCTPHITDKYRNRPDTIRPAFEMLQEALYVKGVEVDLKMSAEYRLIPETWPEVLEKNWLMPIEDRFILMELPIHNPEDIGWIRPIEEFKKVLSLGLIPLLPHPERYFYLSESELMSYVEAGVQIQSNYGSLAGLYGPQAQKNAEDLSRKGIVSHYGTDMHNSHYVKVIGEWFAKGNTIEDYHSSDNTI